MTYIAILYMLAAGFSVIASIPQVVTLYRVKCSDEFQLSTWIVWLFTQVVSLAYMISLGNGLLIATNTLWVAFYLLMVVLIVAYRPKALLRIRFNRLLTTFSLHRNG